MKRVGSIILVNNLVPQPDSTLLAYVNMIRYDPTLVDLTSNFFVLHQCENLFI